MIYNRISLLESFQTLKGYELEEFERLDEENASHEAPSNITINNLKYDETIAAINEYLGIEPPQEKPKWEDFVKTKNLPTPEIWSNGKKWEDGTILNPDYVQQSKTSHIYIQGNASSLLYHVGDKKKLFLSDFDNRRQMYKIGTTGTTINRTTYDENRRNLLNGESIAQGADLKKELDNIPKDNNRNFIVLNKNQIRFWDNDKPGKLCSPIPFLRHIISSPETCNKFYSRLSKEPGEFPLLNKILKINDVDLEKLEEYSDDTLKKLQGTVYILRGKDAEDPAQFVIKINNAYYILCLQNYYDTKAQKIAHIKYQGYDLISGISTIVHGEDNTHYSLNHPSNNTRYYYNISKDKFISRGPQSGKGIRPEITEFITKITDNKKNITDRVRPILYKHFVEQNNAHKKAALRQIIHKQLFKNNKDLLNSYLEAGKSCYNGDMQFYAITSEKDDDIEKIEKGCEYAIEGHIINKPLWNCSDKDQSIVFWKCANCNYIYKGPFSQRNGRFHQCPVCKNALKGTSFAEQFSLQTVNATLDPDRWEVIGSGYPVKDENIPRALQADIAIYDKKKSEESPAVAIIEYDGPSHLFDFYNNDEEKQQKTYQNDRRKNDWCSKNQVHLYRIYSLADMRRAYTEYLTKTKQEANETQINQIDPYKLSYENNLFGDGSSQSENEYIHFIPLTNKYDLNNLATELEEHAGQKELVNRLFEIIKNITNNKNQFEYKQNDVLKWEKAAKKRLRKNRDIRATILLASNQPEALKKALDEDQRLKEDNSSEKDNRFKKGSTKHVNLKTFTTEDQISAAQKIVQKYQSKPLSSEDELEAKWLELDKVRYKDSKGNGPRVKEDELNFGQVYDNWDSVGESLKIK